MRLVVVVLVMALFMALVIVPVVVLVPMVVMFNLAPIALPVPRKVSFSVVMRRHPSSPCVRWPSPITFMPLVMLFPRIPITVYPYELGAWAWR